MSFFGNEVNRHGAVIERCDASGAANNRSVRPRRDGGAARAHEAARRSPFAVSPYGEAT
ncbi:unnamed protein product [Burkholderia pseudomallei]|nr:unnamed protein product [Burkholderia pseudomallei]